MTLDYGEPIRYPDGAVAQFAPLAYATVAAALADANSLRYHYQGDLGGFLPAPIDENATSGGRRLVGAPLPPHQIPTYAHAGSGKVTIFAAVGGLAPNTPADNGIGPVPGLGVPPPPPPYPGPPVTTTTLPSPPSPTGSTLPTTSTTAPPAPTSTTATASGPPGPRGPRPTASTRPARRPGTTLPVHPTTTTSPRHPTTTAPAPTTTTSPRHPTTTTTSPVGANCSPIVTFVEVGSRPACRLVATGMAPGAVASELIAITNETKEPFRLSMQLSGAPSNALWGEVKLWVTNVGSGSVAARARTLAAWTGTPTGIATLAAGASVRLELSLELPVDAGNRYQGLTAPFDVIWHAEGTP